MTNPQDARWFVSPAGDDAWSGRLPEADAAGSDGPFRTLARACSAAGPGDTCCLRQGVYRETLRPIRDGTADRPIVFRPYQDETVELCGADVLTGWTAGQGRIVTAAMPWDLADRNQLFADGEPLTEARWPKNTGTHLQPVRATATTGTTGSLSDPALPTDRDWVGATLWCAGGDQWICWSETVTAFDPASHTLSFTMKRPEHWYTVRPGSPYVLIGARDALDGDGEWWLDRADQRLLLIPPAGRTAEACVIEAKRRLHCIDLAGRSHIHIVGLRFRAGGVRTDAQSRGLRLSRCVGSWVAHSYVLDAGDGGDGGDATGVLLHGQDSQLDGCELSGSSSSILSVDGSGHRIINNHIHDGNYAAKWRGAVRLSGRRILFSHNTVRHSGRDLLSVHGLQESLIQHNDLSEAGWLTRDLGMIYGHNTDFMNTLIRRNRVHDNRAGGVAMGIYFDHCSHNAIVQHNVVWNAAFDPLRINNPSYFTLMLGNSCFASGPVGTFDHSDRNDLFGVRFAGNIVNQPFQLPDHVALEGNLVSADPGYVDPQRGIFTLRPEAPDLGALPHGEPAWSAGHDFAHPPDVAWEPADVDGMNLIRNACFELDTLECWTPSGAVALQPGNGWGNAVLGGGARANTGTSRHELRLGPGPASVAQRVEGLRPGARHTCSAWLRVSVATEAVRLGVRTADDRDCWAEPVTATAWTRVVVDFDTGPDQHWVTVLIEKTSPGDGHACADNLGLPRALAAPPRRRGGG